LAIDEDNLIAANATYAEARASLYQMLATTLQHYGINLQDAATGAVKTAPMVPGLTPVKESAEPSTAPPTNQ